MRSVILTAALLVISAKAAERTGSPWKLVTDREAWREVIRRRLEDDRHLDQLVAAAVKKSLVQGSGAGSSPDSLAVIEGAARVKEVVAAYLDEDGKNHGQLGVRRGGKLPGGGGVVDEVVAAIIAEIFDRVESAVEDLIDYLAVSLEELVDHLIEAGVDEIDYIIDRLEEDLVAALQWAKSEGYGGIPASFDQETRLAIFDIRDDIHACMIIMAIICSIFSTASVAHTAEKALIFFGKHPEMD